MRSHSPVPPQASLIPSIRVNRGAQRGNNKGSWGFPGVPLCSLESREITDLAVLGHRKGWRGRFNSVPRHHFFNRSALLLCRSFSIAVFRNRVMRSTKAPQLERLMLRRMAGYSPENAAPMIQIYPSAARFHNLQRACVLRLRNWRFLIDRLRVGIPAGPPTSNFNSIRSGTSVEMFRHVKLNPTPT